MRLVWTRESPSIWDADKRRVIGAAPRGSIVFTPPADGTLLPGDWWRVDADGRAVGYGWMDYSWGDAEILLAVDPAAQDAGIGTFILDRLEDEAASRGINYLYNVVPDSHPNAAAVTRWLQRRSFVASQEGGLLKRTVRHA
jgi:GNAT superfamily N-acetyltransferase